MPLHWPGHNYLGPGTRDFNKKPVDRDDEIARRHDIAYSNATTPTTIFNADKEAVSEFWDDFNSTGNFHSLVGSGVLKAKNLFEEKVVGHPIYPQMGSDKRKQAPRDEPIPAKRQNVSELGDTLDGMEMETPPSEGQGMLSDDPMGGSRGGNGGSSGGVGGTDPMGDIYGGSTQDPIKHVKEFKKSYHFTLTNGLPAWRRDLQDGHVEHQQRHASIHGIPWEFLAMYCSEGEIARLRENYTCATVLEVKCEVFSLGVRLPFITGQTISTVANANAQYPIGLFHFDRDFITSYDPVNVHDILLKCQGTEWKTMDDIPTDWSESYPSITASATSRDMRNPVIIHYPRQAWFLPGASENWPKDCGIYDYVNIKNGSSAYGLAWSMTHRPKQGVLFSHNSTALAGGQYVVNGSNPENTPLPGEYSYWTHLSDVFTNRLDSLNPAAAFRLSRAKNYNTFTRIQVDNQGIFGIGSEKCAAKAMPKFMIGFVNVRNEDDSLLHAKWEILVKCHIKIMCTDNGQRGFINHVRSPVPFAWDPLVQYSSETENSTRLIPNWNVKNNLYGKRAMITAVEARDMISKAALDELFKTKPNDLPKRKKEIVALIDDEIKRLKEVNNPLKKYKHHELQETIDRLETAKKNFQ